MEMFNKIDRNRNGVITSQYPAWYSAIRLDDLEETVARKARELDSGLVPPNKIPEAREELKREQEKLEAVKDSKPVLDDKSKDTLYASYKQLSKLIKDTLFSYDEMHKNLASPHEEANRMKKPIIEVKNENLKGLAEACGVSLKKRNDKKGSFITRDGASKMFKIAGNLLGEATNIEVLRPNKRRA